MGQYMTEIIIAVLSLIGAALGSYSGFRLTAYRVEQLEKKVETHNNFAARIPLLERDINEVKTKISELERKIGRS
jgi:hypothetical protein|nr:MAG TPA: hemolysin [Caudoviricetes sp.]